MEQAFRELDDIDGFKIPDHLFYSLKHNFETYFHERIPEEEFMLALARYIFTEDKEKKVENRLKNIRKFLK